MADHILMIDGNEDIVSEFNARLLELGMIPVEIDTANNSGRRHIVIWIRKKKLILLKMRLSLGKRIILNIHSNRLQ